MDKKTEKMVWEFVNQRLIKPIHFEGGKGIIGFGATVVTDTATKESFPAITLSILTEKKEIGESLPKDKSLDDCDAFITFRNLESLAVMKKMVAHVERHLKKHRP